MQTTLKDFLDQWVSARSVERPVGSTLIDAIPDGSVEVTLASRTEETCPNGKIKVQSANENSVKTRWQGDSVLIIGYFLVSLERQGTVRGNTFTWHHLFFIENTKFVLTRTVTFP